MIHEMNGRQQGIIVAVIASSMWGFFGLFTRTLNGYGLSVNEISFIRSSVTAIILGVILLIFDRDALKVRKKDLIFILLLGVTKMISDTCQVNAQLNIPLALSSVIQLTYPYFVMFFAFLLFKERMTKKKVIAAILGFIGCIFVTNLSFSGDINPVGIVFAFAASIVIAVNVMDVKICVERSYSPAAIVFWMFGICALFNLPLCDMSHTSNAVSVDPTSILWMLGVGLLMTMIPHAMDNWAMTKVEAGTVAIIGIMETIVASVVGIVFFSEELTALSFIGIMLAICAVILVNKDSAERKGQF